MKETKSQTVVTEGIIKKQTTDVMAGVTDNELAVVVRVEEVEAAYTAKEARDLAQSIKQASMQQKWDADTENIVAYLHDLADLVDNDMTESQVKEKWELWDPNDE